MTNPAASDPGPASTMSQLGLSPMHLYDPVHVPLLADVLSARDVDAAWSGLRERWGDVAPVDLGSGARAWLVTGYQTIVMLVRDSGMVTTETHAWNGEPHGPLPASLRSSFRPRAGETVVTAPGPVHARLRVPLDEVLEAVDAAEVGRVARVVCEELVDRLGSLDRADLMREYAAPVAHLAFGTVLGLGPETGRQVFELADALAAGEGDASSLDELSFLLGGQVMGRDAGGGLTPVGLLAQHRAYEGTDEAVLGMLSLATGASLGLQAWLGRALLLAVTDERFFHRLAGGRLGTDEALDEVLWDASPVTALAPRFAVTEGPLFGEDTYVERGDAVLLAVGAVASDPRIRGEGAWDGLGNRAHLAWGAGSHRCPAPGQARLIVRTAVETLLRRVEPVLAISVEEIRWAPDFRFRRPDSLPVTFRPTGPGG
ncbi:cytochrome P450 [Antribacter sp. KLBMP9083]|uniref:Cytochrome P450 n=1 Tax=Antribacter soli TaxID=2910976 RepID=A0AA41QDV7_9MICO|nr:cytochrome P450 [Antribacter soli]MCF4120786.1 cytochrome P450 [Antribacter soli]